MQKVMLYSDFVLACSFVFKVGNSALLIIILRRKRHEGIVFRVKKKKQL